MNLDELEKLLGYEFTDREMLMRAVTHRSWAHEEYPGETEQSLRGVQNESLEFVGDSVLGLVIAELLYRAHPGLSEGDLTLMKHSLVSTATLAGVAREMEIGEFIRLGRGEKKTGGRDKTALLANTLEALIAAVFFDGGYEKASEFVARILAGKIESTTPGEANDFKTMLQEKLQAEKLAAPKYALLKAEGMPHSRTFVVEAVWNGGRSVGTGRSIKSAEMMAASEALNALKLEETAEQE